LASGTKYWGLFLNSKTFLRNSKKSGKVYNSHKHLIHEFQVISRQNAKVMAKKLISMQRMTENSTSVFCNDTILITLAIIILLFDFCTRKSQ